jgi:hypothetical protein
MKLQYEEIQVKLVMLSAQDVLTMSGFEGGGHDLGNPNTDPIFEN